MPKLIDAAAAVAVLDAALADYEPRKMKAIDARDGLMAEKWRARIDTTLRLRAKLRALPSPTCATCAEWHQAARYQLPDTDVGSCQSDVYAHGPGGVHTHADHSCAAYKPKESRPVPSDPLSIANEFAATMRRAAK